MQIDLDNLARIEVYSIDGQCIFPIRDKDGKGTNFIIYLVGEKRAKNYKEGFEFKGSDTLKEVYETLEQKASEFADKLDSL